MTHGAASRRAVAAGLKHDARSARAVYRAQHTALAARSDPRVEPDATVEQHGSLALVRWHTDAARDWIRDNVQDNAQYFGGALVVEPRYVAQLVEGMITAGLVVA